MACARRYVIAALAAGLLPIAATAEPRDVAAGRVALDGGLGPAQRGAPFLLLGVNLGIFDDTSRRIDLRGRVGILATQEVRTAGAMSDAIPYNGMALIADVAHAWRVGRLEPWLSIGVARLTADLDEVASATGPSSTDRSIGPALGAGVRVAVGTNTFISADALFTRRTASKMTWLSPVPQLGGASLILAVTYRLGYETTRVGSPAPPDPVAPPALPAGPQPPAPSAESSPAAATSDSDSTGPAPEPASR